MGKKQKDKDSILSNHVDVAITEPQRKELESRTDLALELSNGSERNGLSDNESAVMKRVDGDKESAREQDGKAGKKEGKKVGKAQPAATAEDTIRSDVDASIDESEDAGDKVAHKRAKKSGKNKDKPMGTDKAVETMFRNAVRAEMDLIALAAMKANIMISLNGLIISALMISGAFIFARSISFLIPAGVFMVTAATSIIFALLAASPDRADAIRGTFDWLRALWRRETSWRDLASYLERHRSLPPENRINLLIYEQRVQMSQDEHWARMQRLLRDRDGIYHTMTDHLYWLGLMAERMFRLLNVSYTVFRWGLLVSVMVFLSVKLIMGVTGGGAPVIVQTHYQGISSFSDIYEPSGVQQLPDGRILVVEDEPQRAFSILGIAEDGTLTEDPAADVRLIRAFGRRLSDLEALTSDDQGRIYAITSHSTDERGRRRADREQFLRFRIQGSMVSDIASATSLRDALAGDQALQTAIAQQTGEQADFSQLDIEGLSYRRLSQDLLLGLRHPVAGGRSIVVPIRNPDAMFDTGAAPVFGAPVLLDLDGGGIRAISYDSVLSAYVLSNEIRGEDGRKVSQLWLWSGEAEDPPSRLGLPGIINLANVESIDSVIVHGQPRLLLMSDEGDAKKNRPARYMFLDYKELED